jgi:hypothetical protein
MTGVLPDKILRRPKERLYRDDLAELLSLHLPAMPVAGDAVEEFVDLSKLPESPGSYTDIHALTRVAVLHHWLKSKYG